MKRQAEQWENIFENTSDKSLIAKIYKELRKLNTKKLNNLNFKKWANDLNTLLQNEDIHQ